MFRDLKMLVESFAGLHMPNASYLMERESRSFTSDERGRWPVRAGMKL